jgi:hypothetical protein
VSIGDFALLNNRIGVIVESGETLGGDLTDHVAIWFGDLVDGSPEVWTVPIEVVRSGPEPIQRH